MNQELRKAGKRVDLNCSVCGEVVKLEHVGTRYERLEIHGSKANKLIQCTGSQKSLLAAA